MARRYRAYFRTGTTREQLLAGGGRLLGALGEAEGFPQDRVGLKELFARAAPDPDSDEIGFLYESVDELPRYGNPIDIWVAPAGEGRLRLRTDKGDLTSLLVTLSPDGRFGEIETLDGFGVPDDELTEQARADRAAYERRLAKSRTIDHEAIAAEAKRRQEERVERFRVGNLVRTLPGPADQDRAGPVVTYLALYESGVVVNYLVPRPDTKGLDFEEVSDVLHAAGPDVTLDDGSGIEFRFESDSVDPNGEGPLRGRRHFARAPAEGAARLRVELGTTSVEIDLAAR